MKQSESNTALRHSIPLRESDWDSCRLDGILRLQEEQEEEYDYCHVQEQDGIELIERLWNETSD